MVLVFCPNGHVFQSREFDFEDVQGLKLRGNREPCPFCGATAELMDGEFDILGGILRVLSAPDVTLDRLWRLQAVVLSLRQERAPPERADKALQEEAPELARLLPKNPGHLLAVLAILVSIIGILVQHYDATRARSLSDEDVERIIKTVIDHQRAPTTSPPQTAPPQPPPDSLPNPPGAPGPTAPGPQPPPRP